MNTGPTCMEPIARRLHRDHPGVGPGGKDTAPGPVAALMDRTEDTVRKAVGKG
ncbi:MULTISPECIES: hypothetical protein [Streptomyces]|uniref:Uncharacterized protein n=1 Tax=Streptomyces fimbriatus TaxID=68197 RepID=A0ABW0D0R4_STRFI